jgi:DNA topoisomerase-2
MGKTVEETYKKIDNLEHVLLRPDMYVGSIEAVRQNMWIYDQENDKLVSKEIDFIPALYKIYDEIIVNAADNKVRDKNQTLIQVDIDKENNKISILNNGKGIPIEMHKEHKVYVPELIFGQMMTSSNYDDSEKKVTGGRNGFGAKLCNIFSTKFTVETATKRKLFKQTWTGNMKQKRDEPTITKWDKEDYTKITFVPDLNRFKVHSLSNDMIALFQKRAYDIAGVTPGLSVYLDGKKIGFNKKNPFRDYCEMYVKGLMLDTGKPVTVAYEKPTNKEALDRWDVGFAISDIGFQNISFVNSIATTKGGRHVDVVMDQICKKLEDKVNKKNKGGLKVKAHQIKSHCWIFVKAQIENPAFDSQTKENMTLVKSKHGSKPELSDKYIKEIEKSGIVDTICNFMKFKENQGRNKQSGTKVAKVVVEKLVDATEAGKKNSKDCTLILTEGDSAKTAALAGVSSLSDGKRYYGVFPLRGKMLNAREATHAQISNNKEMKNIIKAMGFDFKRKYDAIEDVNRLRYGKLMIMTDQDVDGSHIKGLVVNFLHHFWPNMIRNNIIQEFITPIVKVTAKKNKKDVRNFYSLPEFHKWESECQNVAAFNIKYYKGLGTSTSLEFKDYFTELSRHKIPFRYGGVECDNRIKLGFQKDKVDDRKVWLTEYMADLAHRKQNNEQELTLYDRETIPYITYKDFVDKELVLFSYADLSRSVPNAIDGFKPGQRKVMFVCFKRNDKKEVKVAQLSGSVAEKSAYHHGEVSLMSTIIKLAQDYVGSNNINLLLPNGQFGSRRCGGSDHAAARYIFTQLSPLARAIYPEIDDNLYEYQVDDNQKVEPYHYCPIIPMALVNGSQGIGTGWSTNIPNHCPRELAKNVLLMIDGREPLDVVPKYRNFRGEILEIEKAKCISFGEIAVLDDDTLEITELPIGVWIEVFAERLQKMTGGKDDKGKELPALIEAFEDFSSDSRVRFTVKLSKRQMLEANKQGFHSYLSLQKSMTYSNTMVLFDEFNKLQVYKSTSDIMKNHFNVRKVFYDKRYKFLLGKLEAETKYITNKARFICENIDKKISVMNKKKKVLIQELYKAKYDSDPIAAWKKSIKTDRASVEDGNESDETTTSTDSVEDPDKDYKYLYNMPIFNLTQEQKEKLLAEKGKIESELEELKNKTPSDLWKADIEHFLKELDQFEKKQKELIDDSNKGLKKKKGGKFNRGKSNFTDPSADGERVEPAITDKMKKEAISKGVKREPKAKKEPTVKKETIKKEPGAKKVSPASKKKKGRQEWETDSEEDNESDAPMIGHSSTDDSFSSDCEQPVKKSTKRIRKISSAEEDSQESLPKKPATKRTMKQGSIMDSFKAVSKKIISDSDDSPAKKKVSKKHAVLDSDESEEIDSDVPKKAAKKPATKKALPKKAAPKKADSSDFGDSDDEKPVSLASRAPRAGRAGKSNAKKYNFSSDESD